MDVKDQRQQLLDEMQSPSLRTLEQVRATREKVEGWLRQYPDDLEVLETGEGLFMLESALVKIATK